MAFVNFAQSDAGAAASGIAITMPTGALSGHYALAFGVKDVSSSVVVTPPSGWTVVDTATTANASFPKWAFVYEKILDGTEGASQSWTIASNAAGSITIACWSGRKSSSTRTFETPTVNSSQNASPITLAMTSGVAAAGDDVAVFVTVAKSAIEDWTLTGVTGFTVKNAVGTFTWSTAQLATQDNVSGGALGTIPGTDTVTGSGTAGWAAFIVSMAKAASGGGSSAATKRLSINFGPSLGVN